MMNDVEIHIMKQMLEMDPYKRITARQAIEHDYFDNLRAKDPEYNNGQILEDQDESDSDKSSIDAPMGESVG